MKIILITITLFTALQTFSQEKATVLFYNVENLFDTLDTPNQRDEEYLPSAKTLRKSNTSTR